MTLNFPSPRPQSRRLAVALLFLFPLAGLQAATGWPSEADRIAAYRERCQEVVDKMVEATDASDTTKGGLFAIAANLSAGKNLEWARARLRTVNDPPTGAMFWMHPMVLVMYAGQDNLNAEDWAFIRELWRTYFPFRGDTENHWLMYYTSLYLACQMFPDSGPEAWYNGKSARENMAEAEDYIRDWIDLTTSYGQGEYDSPNYIEEYIRPLALLAGWAEDPEFRQLSQLMLDYIILDFAVEDLDGYYGGAHSRLYPRYTLAPSLTAAYRHAWLLFGQGEYGSNAGNLILALSGYTPPSILYRIARDRDEPYVQKELKRTRWRLRNAGPDAYKIGFRTTTPVYKYSYVHPDFILGSSQGGLLQPIQQQTWSLIWRAGPGQSNTMFGLQPYSDPLEGTMYFVADWDTVTDLIARSKVDYDSPDKLEGGSPYEQVFQYKSTLIALFDMPEDNRFPHIHTFFSRDLEDRVEDPSGWIFARGGPVYIAFRPFVPGEWRPVDWTGLLKSGAGGWFSTNFEELAAGSQLYFSEASRNGYILQVAPASDYDSYEAFKDAVRALPVAIGLGEEPSVHTTALDGTFLSAAYGEAPTIGGDPVDYADWMLFDGPFTRSEKGSGRVIVQQGDQSGVLDLRHPEQSSPNFLER